VSWVDARGRTPIVDARLALTDDGLPASASVQVVRGRLAGARLQLQRQTTATRWAVQADIDGGEVTGPLTLRPAKTAGAYLPAGSLEIRDVEVSALIAPSRTLTGRIDGRTTLRTTVTELGGLADALQTQTGFKVCSAVIHGIDLQQALQTVGLSRGGNTQLDALAGRLETQGGALHLTQLVATAGRMVVDLADAGAGGVIGVPLTVGGTLDSPSVTLSRGALMGAAIGTAVMPAVGTGAGAKLGDRLSQGLRGLFGK
jgi:hypothetical protein